jgi:hypothetical protein
MLYRSSAPALESAWGSGSTWTISNVKGIKPLKEWIEAFIIKYYDSADPDYSRCFEDHKPLIMRFSALKTGEIGR